MTECVTFHKTHSYNDDLEQYIGICATPAVKSNLLSDLRYRHSQNAIRVFPSLSLSRKKAKAGGDLASSMYRKNYSFVGTFMRGAYCYSE